MCYVQLPFVPARYFEHFTSSKWKTILTILLVVKKRRCIGKTVLVRGPLWALLGRMMMDLAKITLCI